MTGGSYICQNGVDSGLSADNWRWCGSSYDALGNPRFNASTAYLDTYTSSLGYGNINFDHVGYGLSFVIQLISGDSWSIMSFQLKNCYSEALSYIFCFFIILYGSFFLLQLNVAMLQTLFTEKSRSIKDAVSKSGLIPSRRKVIRSENDDDELPSVPLPINFYNKNNILSDQRFPAKADYYIVHANDDDDDDIVVDNDDDDEIEEPMLPMKGWDEIYKTSFKDKDSYNQIADGNTMQTDFLSDKTRVFPVNEEITRHDSKEDKPINTQISKKPSFENRKSFWDHLIDIVNHLDNPEASAFRRFMSHAIETYIFKSFFSVMILANTVVLACDKYPTTILLQNIVEVISFLLTLIFCIEMIMMLLGLGLTKYFSNRFNIMDFVIVVISVIDLSLSPMPSYFTGETNAPKSGSANALRSLRLLRLLKLFRSNTFKVLILKILAVVQSMQDFLVILILFLVLFALLGMQLFANRFRFDANGFPITSYNTQEFYDAPDRPRSHFDNFTVAYMTVFQILTIDNWSTVMYNCTRALGPVAMIYPMFIFFMGNFFLTNLVLALLVDNFCDDSILNEQRDNINLIDAYDASLESTGKVL